MQRNNDNISVDWNERRFICWDSWSDAETALSVVVEPCWNIETQSKLFYFKISCFLMLAWFSTALLLPNVNKLVMKSTKSHKCQVISRGIIKYHELSYCIIFTFLQIFGKLWQFLCNLFIKKQNKSTNSLDNLSDDETDAIIDELSQMKIAKSRKVGLVM